MRSAFLFPLLLLALGMHAETPVDRNKQLARRFLDNVWFAGKAEEAAKYIAPEVIVNDPRRGLGLRESPETQARQARQWCVESGDCAASEIVAQVAEGDRVSTYWVLRWNPKGTWAGLLAGTLGQSPVERRAVSLFRFDESGRIVEMSSLRDDLGILTDQGYVNLLIVIVFALGGALGMCLMWLLRRMVRHAA